MKDLKNKYELIGNNIDDVLDAVSVLKFHYCKDYINIEDESGYKSGDNISVYVSFSPEIRLRSNISNIVREMNYIIEEEMKKVKLYKI
jgi:hypothetical protein